MRKRSLQDWSDYGLQRRVDLPGGREYLNFPSMLARRILYYPLSVGDVRWPPGSRGGHPYKQCPFHDDRGYLFHFVVTGSLTHDANGDRFIAAREEAVLLDLRRPVEYVNAGDSAVRLLWVWFDGVGLAELAAELRTGEDPVIRGLNRARVSRIYRELCATVEGEPPGYEVKLSALLGALLAELYRVRPPPALLGGDHPPVALSPSVRKAVTTIARRYARPWSMKELSHLSGLSMYHFFRTFRREMGCSPMQYVNRYRVEQSKPLLATTRLQVDEIARQVGIPNRRNFAKLFRQLTGQSPKVFRARAGAPPRGR